LRRLKNLVPLNPRGLQLKVVYVNPQRTCRARGEAHGCYPDLNLDGDEQEEFSTMLLWLHNQIETGEPSEAIVNECLA
jgi:hypothetical protein